MSQFTPNPRAGGTIAPFRAVIASTSEDDTVVAAGANGIAIGITQGNNSEFDTTNHAVDGEPVRLQTGLLQRIEAGAAITNGLRVKSDSVGRAVPSLTSGTTAQEFMGVAMEAASGAGAVICIKWQPGNIRPAIV